MNKEMNRKKRKRVSIQEILIMKDVPGFNILILISLNIHMKVSQTTIYE